MRSREQAVRDLVALARPLSDLRDELSHHPWDCAEPLVTVRSIDVIDILDRHLDGALSPVQVEAWADAVEIRDDLTFDASTTRDAVFALANPILEGTLTRELALCLRATLASYNRASTPRSTP